MSTDKRVMHVFLLCIYLLINLIVHVLISRITQFLLAFSTTIKDDERVHSKASRTRKWLRTRISTRNKGYHKKGFIKRPHREIEQDDKDDEHEVHKWKPQEYETQDPMTDEVMMEACKSVEENVEEKDTVTIYI